MKLFTIGDSISQGFMSLAAARTDLSYSTLVAEKLGLKSNDAYRYPEWKAGGLPLNIEDILRALQKRYGSDIRNLEWLTVLQTINGVIDLPEDYYERGEGASQRPYSSEIDYFHNVSVRGFEVADAWKITPKVCREEIALNRNRRNKDNYLSGPSAAFYRTAEKVLNPSLAKKYDDFSAISWLKKHSEEEGIENLLLWLGANNALGTVVHLKINQTPNKDEYRPHQRSYYERKGKYKWNLWHPKDFELEYKELLKQVEKAMDSNRHSDWKIFVGTIPLVTIVPLIKGVGGETHVPGKGVYFKYYTYVPFEEDFARATGTHLTMQDAIHIDNCIRAYNETIDRLIKARNKTLGKKRYYLVDIANALGKIAYKRNGGQPQYEFPDYFNFIYPRVNTKYYHVDRDGQLKQGGLFSLDGVHPTAIGHGLIAYEFLKVMKKAGLEVDTELDWQKVFDNDRLYSDPILLMHELYGWDKIAQHIVNLVKLFRE